jgi:hypothetical protein
VKKHVRIQGLKFTEADAKEVDLLQEALDRVPPHGIVQCSLKMDANTRNCCTTLLSNHAIPSRVTRLSVWTGSGYPELSFASFTNLTELCIGGEHLSEKTLLSVLSSSPALKDITLYESSLLGLSTVQALCSHARSLVHLTLLYVLCHPELLSFIGHCCCNLQELAVHSNSGLAVEPSVTEVGLLAIARGCRKLRDFRASDLPSVTEAMLLAVAAHCPEMAILTFDRCAKLTDGVLLAFAAGCPKLRELQCDDWAVLSVDAVDAAQPLLSRLIHFPINSVHEASLATMTRAAMLMSNVVYLSLRDLSPADIAALCHCPVPALQYISLINGPSVVVAVDELVVAMVAGSQQIASISLYGGCTISEATLLTLAAIRAVLWNSTSSL